MRFWLCCYRLRARAPESKSRPKSLTKKSLTMRAQCAQRAKKSENGPPQAEIFAYFGQLWPKIVSKWSITTVFPIMTSHRILKNFRLRRATLKNVKKCVFERLRRPKKWVFLKNVEFPPLDFPFFLTRGGDSRISVDVINTLQTHQNHIPRSKEWSRESHLIIFAKFPHKRKSFCRKLSKVDFLEAHNNNTKWYFFNKKKTNDIEI